MNEFLLIFRRDYLTNEKQPTPEQMEAHLVRWQEWFRTLAAGDHLARQLQRWDNIGKLIHSDGKAAGGPYTEIKESIGGIIIIWASHYDEAIETAKGCPIYELGGNVEIRMGGLSREQ